MIYSITNSRELYVGTISYFVSVSCAVYLDDVLIVWIYCSTPLSLQKIIASSVKEIGLLDKTKRLETTGSNCPCISFYYIQFSRD